MVDSHLNGHRVPDNEQLVPIGLGGKDEVIPPAVVRKASHGDGSGLGSFAPGSVGDMAPSRRWLWTSAVRRLALFAVRTRK